MPTVVDAGPVLVGRPRDDVRKAVADLVIAAGAPVNLDRRLTGDGPDGPLAAVRAGLQAVVAVDARGQVVGSVSGVGESGA